MVIRIDGRITAAAQLRIARLPLLPVGVAYLRWGPLCQRKGEGLDASMVRLMSDTLMAEYSGRRRYALKVIPNAYEGNLRGDTYISALSDSKLYPEPDGPRYRTVSVDLTPSPENIRKQLDQKWRNQLNRSEKNGLTLEISDGQDAYVEFIRLYEAMLARKQFETSVDVAEFEQIQSCLPSSCKMQTFLAKKDGQPVGGLVCSVMGNTAIYLLGATNETAREIKAAYFLQWQAMLRLKQLGAHSYDLGGINPNSNPGGYHFKCGFGGLEVNQLPTHAGSCGLVSKIVLRAITYRQRLPHATTQRPAANQKS